MTLEFLPSISIVTGSQIRYWPETAKLFAYLEWLTRLTYEGLRSSYALRPHGPSPVSKELWQQLQPLIPTFVPSSKGDPRKRTVSDEAALNGILFVLQTGISWEDLPQSMGFGSGMTCWRRLRDW